jgi:Rha family phage regulatory protein
MNELINIKNDEAVTTSLQVAEFFHKRHDTVLRSIEGLLSENTKLWFQKSTYKTKGNNKTYPMYYINRDGFSLLAMGFNGKKALEWKIKYIEAFNQMESYITLRKVDVALQKNAMTFLHDNLEMPTTKDYVKANTIADKAVSNLFGFPKMIKKDEMSQEMLEQRMPIMKETVELMAIKDKYGVPEHVSKTIYQRYEKKEAIV